jgi:hypothetical protein
MINANSTRRNGPYTAVERRRWKSRIFLKPYLNSVFLCFGAAEETIQRPLVTKAWYEYLSKRFLVADRHYSLCEYDLSLFRVNITVRSFVPAQRLSLIWPDINLNLRLFLCSPALFSPRSPKSLQVLKSALSRFILLNICLQLVVLARLFCFVTRYHGATS